ncbi:monoglyceride lipase, putative [Entamoeba dispar SAW760]|uniref:Monoglyceride lipase, putative n=1 Tax=Entamoeba dispar (strain ATCC PRA-260 / SAW760) TaxID=370354 RepID=B0ERK4_ENTDS|nr:monoglyceride lipase, putative [Entamoeba dispar SAW760]EDR22862.1 monoglyceride lipase, putative [Entamoeba dispar SAW760]|eukprot:EDR22862.1 monoglyceride lipase, putative [Entamoeba dispar SAW760]
MQINYIETIYSINKFNIYSTEWNVEKPQAMIILIHGFCTYAGVMKRMANMLVSHNILLCMPDLPYHGRSSGEPKGWVNSFTTFTEICNKYIDQVKEKYNPNGIIPIYIMGHSMGGLIVSIIGRQRKDLKGVIGSAPAYEINNIIVILFYLIIVIILYFIPKLYLPLQYSDKEFPRKEVRQMFEEDQYVTKGKIYLKTIIEMIKYGEREKYSDIFIPFLLIQGINDESVTMKGAQIKSTHLKNQYSQFIIYKDCIHCLYEEKNLKEQIINIINWIQKVNKNHN